MKLAKQAVDQLLNFYPPLDVGDPEAFIAGLVALFASYPAEVMQQAVDPVRGVPPRCKVLRLAEAREVLDDLRQRFDGDRERNLARQAIEATKPLLLPLPPRTPEEQARIDQLVAEARALHGIPPEGLRRDKFIPRPSDNAGYYSRVPRSDGNSYARIAADLAARKQRNAADLWQDWPAATDEEMAAFAAETEASA